MTIPYVGIDPSLTSTGFAALLCDGQRVHSVLGRWTIVPHRAQTLPSRLDFLARCLRSKLDHVITLLRNFQTLDARVLRIVIEDPSDFWRFGAKRGGAKQATRLGMAVGVAIREATDATKWDVFHVDVDTIASHEWIRAFGGGAGRLMRHDALVRQARMLHGDLRSAPEDQAVAAAMAFVYHLTRRLT